MASKGPKFDAPSTVAKTAKRAAVAPAVPVLAEAPAAESIPPVLAAIAPKPVIKRAPKPVVATPVAAPAVETPVAAEPFATEPVAAAPAAAAPAVTETTQPAAAPAPAPFQKDETMDTMTNVAEKTETQAHAMFADANDRAKTAMEKGTKLLADMNDFSKGNIEAVVESSKIAAKGAEDVARYTTDYAKAAVEKANAAARQFAAVKSPTELLRLQSELAKDAVDSMMAETAKFTENYLKLLGEIAQPISNRVAVAAEKMKIAA